MQHIKRDYRLRKNGMASTGFHLIFRQISINISFQFKRLVMINDMFRGGYDKPLLCK